MNYLNPINCIKNLPAGDMLKPLGSLAKFTAGWFWSRAKQASEGSKKTISS